jgi:site-specific recombinase XerD
VRAAADLVFPNTRGKPDSLHIEVVKRVAQRTKLNCGQCETKHGNRCADGPHCKRFFLHKFRHTFATEHLRDGVDIRTLQSWMGYRDIHSTMVYLKGIQSKDAVAKVNARFPRLPYRPVARCEALHSIRVSAALHGRRVTMAEMKRT